MFDLETSRLIALVSNGQSISPCLKYLLSHINTKLCLICAVIARLVLFWPKNAGTLIEGGNTFETLVLYEQLLSLWPSGSGAGDVQHNASAIPVIGRINFIILSYLGSFSSFATYCGRIGAVCAESSHTSPRPRMSYHTCIYDIKIKPQSLGINYRANSLTAR
jgi:hypothetical protein